jgi:DNA-binding response OmpR family regulator
LERDGDIVLVVDDSPDALGFITHALEKAGINVLVATSGETALRIAAEVLPDVVLMDAVMPGLDGFQTCRRMKTLAGLANVPVIFMTALTETEHVVNGLESGGVDYLTKPINLEELRARMRVHLALARQTRSARIALDAAGRHLMAFAASGALHWATPQATRLISQPGTPPDSPTLMGTRIHGWLGQRTASSGETFGFRLGPALSLQLTYLGAIAADEHLFRLVAESDANQEEALRQHFRLTARESEVLLWIARGKSNRDIADVLSLSPRTVNKHLEQIFAKLGVENRATAAVKAMQVLNP